MSIHRVTWTLLLIVALVSLSACIAPRPIVSPPITPAPSILGLPLSSQFTNLLKNGDFDLPTHYQPKGETGLVIPTDWKVFAVDGGGYLKLYQASGVVQLGRYVDVRYGARLGQNSPVLRAETLHICRVPPYLDPLRILEGECAITAFKLYGHLLGGMQQTWETEPGHLYRIGGQALGWSRMDEDPNDAHYSHGVGTGPFYAVEGDPVLNDSNDNFRFRICVDPYGAENIFGSAVVCGPGAIIYNEFHSIPSLTFMARADSATFFWVYDTRFGMKNSNAYGDSFFVEDITPPTPTPTASPAPTYTPTATRTPGPTVTPPPGISVTCQLSITPRVMVLLPPGYEAEWYVAAAPSLAEKGWSIGTSAVDACVNSCANRVVIAVNVWERGCNLYPACHAPCDSLSYIPLWAQTPSDLAALLVRYPEWMREAWGLCLPLVVRQ